MIEVDPECGEEAEWLRRVARWGFRRVNEGFPESGLFFSSALFLFG